MKVHGLPLFLEPWVLMEHGVHTEPSGALSDVCPRGQEEVNPVEGTATAKAWHGSDAHEKAMPKGTASWETLRVLVFLWVHWISF